MISYMTISIAIIILYYLFSLWNTYQYWKRKGIIGPKPLPLVGNYGLVIFKMKTEAELLQKLYEEYPNEKCIGIYQGTIPLLLLRDLTMTKQVLIKDFHIFPDKFSSILEAKFDKNILTTNGETWRILRPYMSSLFTNSKLNKLLPLMTKNLNVILEHLENTIQKKEENDVKICEILKKLHTRTITSTLLGRKYYCDLSSNYKVEENSEQIFIGFTITLVHMLQMIFPYVLNILEPILNHCFDKAYKFFKDMIIPAMYDDVNNRTEFMNSLMNLKEKGRIKTTDKNGKILEMDIDDDVVIQQSVITILAANEGLSSITSLMIYQMTLNDVVLKNAYTEVTSVLNRHNGQLTLESINEMRYLEMVFYETLRVHPTNHFIDRVCISNYKFNNINLKIDKGMRILLSIHGLHKDPKYFPNPKMFDPERFSPVNKAKIPQCAYLAFGDGPRHCTGKRLAKLVVMMTVAIILNKFKISLSEKNTGKIVYDPYRIRAVKPLNEIWIKIQHKDNKWQSNKNLCI